MEQLIIFLVLLTLGFGFGRLNERRHFASIRQREQQYSHLLCFSFRHLPQGCHSEGQLVTGSVVVSIDYFKRIAAGLRGLLGGRITAYETLVERARREAVLRMKAEAEQLGASKVINVKLETASVFKNAQETVGAVEVVAYGTALR
ncbi:MAG: YbjQ family protein [Cellvibrionaceae bacterium]|nr:YbjQ family protein [Cellvibrionaceae bacterium]MCV6624722.1 YbjQ family protein [Cellvibrionaceae bacterium]